MKRTAWAAAILASASSLGLASAVAAQDLDQGGGQSFDRDRNVSVRERPRPEYDALGLRRGSFLIFPKATVDAEYNDNIFASSQKADDIILRSVLEATVRSDWSRNSLAAYGRLVHHAHLEYSSDNTTDWRLGGRGELEVGRGAVTVGAEAAQLTEPRWSTDTPVTAAEPVRFGQGMLSAQFGQELNRLRLVGRAEHRVRDYENNRDRLGNAIPQDFRDHASTSLSGRAEYAVSPDTAVFFAAGVNRRRYDLHPPRVAFDRDSAGVQVTAGTNFDITRLIRGEVQAGYLRQEYEDPRFGEISGLAARGEVEWFATQLTTITFTGERTVEESASLTAAGYLNTQLAVQADHELLRNIILTARASVQDAEYSGIDRRDRFLGGSLGVNWLVNRRVGLAATYSRLQQESSGAAARPDFNINRLIVSLVLQL